MVFNVYHLKYEVFVNCWGRINEESVMAPYWDHLCYADESE